MPPRKKTESLPAELKTADYRHSAEKRTNIPPARMAGEGTVPQVPKARYSYSPHLTPTLQFDPTGEPDKLSELAEAATKRVLTREEAERLKEGLRVLDPALEWAGKREQRERGFLEVDPVALHIHERVSTRAIVRAALREDVQRDMFADPQQPYREAVQFYRHDVDWANRLILGDSLQVMSSLARRESLSGKVQMIYMDPPYGIKFASNFQSEIGNQQVKDRDSDLTREPEMVRAYRDTWQLGLHSYLTYLRDRLMAARELLTDSGSIFVQISDENLHRVRALLDEIFGAENALSIISYVTTSGFPSTTLSRGGDYLLWYAKSATSVKYRQLYVPKGLQDPSSAEYKWVLLPDGSTRNLTNEERRGECELPLGARVWRHGPLTSSGASADSSEPFMFRGKSYFCGPNNHWKVTRAGLRRLELADLLVARENSLSWYLFLDSFPVAPINNTWVDTKWGFDAGTKAYVVQTNAKVIERCIQMTTDPGDLVLDPTCGSGTTAVTAEQWGRRWITIDTSRVAIGIARQRVLTAQFPQYQLRGADGDPSGGFVYRTVPHLTLRSVSRNEAIDRIADEFEPKLSQRLSELNQALTRVPQELREELRLEFTTRQKQVGKRFVTETDRRRLLLPDVAWQAWEVPFEHHEKWPVDLQLALKEYRVLWREKADLVNRAIAANADQEELVDQPEIARGIVRVAGPFTVEGVRPEELNLGEDGLFDGTPNEFEHEEHELVALARQQNLHAYLERMVRLIKQDGLTFINNQRRKLSQIEPLFDAGIGTVLHAEGTWEGSATDTFDVAISFGPQYGPVTALQVEDLLRASKRYSELVIAGFSFDADATSVIQQYSNSRLRIHQAYIRPDVNPGMDGLLKDTPNSQLFTVFGTPEIEVRRDKDGDWIVELKGVDVYDPVANTIRSTGANKVAAWFLDSDFDGRCFATTQAFFPDQDAWDKIAKALGTSANAETFEAFNGTVCVPFSAGTYRRIAVKVIDPRGNEVMAVRALEG